MADGDHINHIVKSAFGETTDGSSIDLLTVDLSEIISTEALISCTAYVVGVKNDKTSTYSEKLFTIGVIDDGAIAMSSDAEIGSHDGAGGLYGVGISGDGVDTIKLTVNGEARDAVGWLGRIEVDITEFELLANTGGGS